MVGGCVRSNIFLTNGGQEITLSLTFDQQPQTTGTEDDSSNQNQGQQDSYGDLYDYFFGRGNSGRGN